MKHYLVETFFFLNEIENETTNQIKSAAANEIVIMKMLSKISDYGTQPKKKKNYICLGVHLVFFFFYDQLRPQESI